MAEANPEISADDHPIVRSNYYALVRSEPRLEEIFQNHRIIRTERRRQYHHSEERYASCFENASDIIFTFDFEGSCSQSTALSKELPDYTRAEAPSNEADRCGRTRV